MQKVKPFRCKNYLQFVRSQPCSHCMSPQTIAHHLIGTGSGVMGSKSSDFDAMALCGRCHALIHENYKAFDQMLYLHRMQSKALSNGVVAIIWEG